MSLFLILCLFISPLIAVLLNLFFWGKELPAKARSFSFVLYSFNTLVSFALVILSFLSPNAPAILFAQHPFNLALTPTVMITLCLASTFFLTNLLNASNKKIHTSHPSFFALCSSSYFFLNLALVSTSFFSFLSFLTLSIVFLFLYDMLFLQESSFTILTKNLRIDFICIFLLMLSFFWIRNSYLMPNQPTLNYFITLCCSLLFPCSLILFYFLDTPLKNFLFKKILHISFQLLYLTSFHLKFSHALSMPFLFIKTFFLFILLAIIFGLAEKKMRAFFLSSWKNLVPTHQIVFTKRRIASPSPFSRLHTDTLSNLNTFFLHTPFKDNLGVPIAIFGLIILLGSILFLP